METETEMEGEAETKRERRKERERRRERQRQRNRQRDGETGRNRETERQRQRNGTQACAESKGPWWQGGRRGSGGSTNGPGWAGGRREAFPGTQAVCRVAASVTSLTAEGGGWGRRPPTRAQSGRLAPPAAAVNTGALHADRDRHSRGRGRVGWKGLRQRGLSGKPLRHLYLTERPEGSRIEGSS